MTQEVPELPQLPDPWNTIDGELWGQNTTFEVYTADQMRAYAREALTQAVADAQRLREFAQLVMDNWPHGDVDGGDLQEAAIRCGLLEPQTRTEPCSEGCNCMDYYASDEWSEGITCYRKTALLKGATRSTA
jgi:hypothetical protein